MSRKLYLTVLIPFLFSFNTIAQYQIGLIPRLSPSKSISAKLNYTDIKVDYGSPKVNSRSIWGGKVPYDKVWRAGADNATTIEISHDIIVQEKILPKGKYSIFIIPHNNDKWEVVFNKIHKQWGAFDYNEKENVLTVNSSPSSNHFREELTYEIQDLGLGNGILSFQWEKVKLNLSINTSFLDQLKSQVVSRSDTLPDSLKFGPYLQGAQHLINNSTEIELAETWINKSEKLFDPNVEWNKNFYPKIYITGHIQWIKAKVLARQGKFNEALSIVGEMKKGKDKYTFYNYMGKRDRVDDYEAHWKLNKNIE